MKATHTIQLSEAEFCDIKLAAYNKGFNDALDQVELLLSGTSERAKALRLSKFKQPGKDPEKEGNL